MLKVQIRDGETLDEALRRFNETLIKPEQSKNAVRENFILKRI